MKKNKTKPVLEEQVKEKIKKEYEGGLKKNNNINY